MKRFLLCVMCLLWLSPALRAQELSALARVDPSASGITDGWFGRTDIALHLSQGVPFRVFTLDDPARLVVDFREIDFDGLRAAAFLNDSTRINSVRFGAFQPGWSRLVADLAEPALPREIGMPVDVNSGRATLEIMLKSVSPEDFAAAAGAPADPNWKPAFLKAAPPPPARKTRQTSKGLKVSVAIAALLSVSMGVAFWLNPEVGDQILAKVTDLVDVSGKANKKSDSTAANQADDKPAPGTVGADGKEVPPGAPNLTQLEPKVELVPGPQPAATASASSPVPELAAVAPPPAPPEPVKEVAAKVITELPDAAIKGRLWLKSLPTDAYVLEHQSFDTVKEARAFTKDKEWLVNARIAPVFTLGKDEARFAIMTGPFRTVDRAKNTISRLKLSSNVTITSVQVATKQSEPSKANKSKP